MIVNRNFDSRRRKESFDSVATYYDKYRRGYPSQVIDDVLELTHIGRGGRVLEIACGTGQLSVPIAKRGAQLTAVELGPALAEIARRNLSRFPEATVEVGKFEDWPDVKGGTSGFSSETQQYYVKWGLSDSPTFEAPDSADLPPMYPELDQLAEFTSVRRHRFQFLRAYTSESYVGLLHTDSLVLSLDESAREGFLHDIRRLIDTRFDGHVSKKFVYEVIAAHNVI